MLNKDLNIGWFVFYISYLLGDEAHPFVNKFFRVKFGVWVKAFFHTGAKQSDMRYFALNVNIMCEDF